MSAMASVCKYIQNRRGHALPPVWVFGMVDVTHIPAIGYMEIVDQRDAATLLPIIQQHINPGTTVWSDMWPPITEWLHCPELQPTRL